MKQRYLHYYHSLDLDRMLRHTATLYEIERGQTFTHYHRAVDYVAEILAEEGIPNVERFSFPADGRTVYQDKRMPLAWDASVGRLTLLNAAGVSSANDKFAPASDVDDVIADYARDPFHLVKGSTATPPGGVIANLLTEAQFLAGNDARGALVVLEPETWPRRNCLTPILDRGGLGFVTDFLIDRHETPDAIQWVQATTENFNWHVDTETRPFIGFSVSPRGGTSLRAKAARGGLRAKVECDGRRYEGTVPGVTALIPGRRREEFWLIAHLFEPLATDDSNGVAAAIETARQIMTEGTPEFSLRLLFTLELYGYAAYFEERRARAANESRSDGTEPLRRTGSRKTDPLGIGIVGACNFDSVPSTKNSFVRLELGGPGTPFYGNALAEILAGELRDIPEAPEVRTAPHGDYFDDLFLTDSDTGIPTVWPLNGFPDAVYWHNSAQNMDHIDPEAFRRGTAFDAALVQAIVRPEKRLISDALALAKRRLEAVRASATSPEQFDHLYRVERKRFADFALFAGDEALSGPLMELDLLSEKLSDGIAGQPRRSAWRDYAALIKAKRIAPGFPQDLDRVPKDERIEIPDGTIYGPFANVLANMDGRKDLARLIREAEYERGVILDENGVKRFVLAACFLADYGYLVMENRGEIRLSEITTALEKLGVRRGDFLMVHSSLSACGHVDGGAETVIQSLREAVGPEGTVLFPAFNRPYRLLGGVNCQWSYRPYDRNDLSSLKWVGAVPITFLRHHPDASRSAHYTHSWTGFGPHALEALAAHRPDDSPASADSPMGKALEFKGKILHFGSGLGSTTFLHYFEDRFDLPGLGPAVVGVREPDGSTRDVLIPKHLPGDRDFYHHGEEGKFFTRAKEAGLEILRAPLGVGELKLIEMKSLYEIGCRLCEADPNVFL